MPLLIIGTESGSTFCSAEQTAKLELGKPQRNKTRIIVCIIIGVGILMKENSNKKLASLIKMRLKLSN